MRVIVLLALSLAVASATLSIPLMRRPKSVQQIAAANARRAARFQAAADADTTDFPSVPLTDTEDSEYYGEVV